MAQLISYLHHLYTLFITRASRTLDWTRALAFWAVQSGFWRTKTPLIDHCVIEINRYVSDLLQFTTLQKQSANTNTHLILTCGSCQLFLFCCLFSCFFPESWTWLHIFFLNCPGDPFFKSCDPPEGHDPGFENHWCRGRRAVGREHSPEELQCWSYGCWMCIFPASLASACLSGSWWYTDGRRWARRAELVWAGRGLWW